MIPNIVTQMLRRRGIDINAVNNIRTPDEMAQYLLNAGKVDQNMVNQSKQMWNNPQIQQQIYNNFQRY